MRVDGYLVSDDPSPHLPRRRNTKPDEYTGKFFFVLRRRNTKPDEYTGKFFFRIEISSTGKIALRYLYVCSVQ
jgi:hypothetical protein